MSLKTGIYSFDLLNGHINIQNKSTYIKLCRVFEYFESIHSRLDKNIQKAEGRWRNADSALCWLPEIQRFQSELEIFEKHVSIVLKIYTQI